MTQKKIIVYSETFLPQMGGMERNSQTLCSTLVTLGYKVQLITTTPSNDETLKFPFPVLRTRNKAALALRIFSADLIIVNGGVALKALLFGLLSRKRYIIIYQMATLYFWPGNGILNFIYKKAFVYFARHAKLNVGVNISAMDDLRKLRPSIPFTLLNPIDNELLSSAEVLRNQEIEKKYDVLFVGRIIRGKGVFLLAEALKILQKKHKVVCAVAGIGIDMEELKTYCESKEIKSVCFLGRLDNEKLLRTYCEAKFLVVPSTTHTEGSPLTIAESITLGTPVLVSDQQAMIDTAGEAGLSFSSGNVYDMVAKMEMLLFDGVTLDVKKRSCDKIAEKFSPQFYQQKLKEIISTAFGEFSSISN